MATAEIHVTLKPTLLDAQGATVLRALRQLDLHHAHDVRIGKYITIEFDDSLPASEISAQLEMACRDLLANPVIEDYRITLPNPGGMVQPAGPAARVVATDTVPLAASAVEAANLNAAMPSAVTPVPLGDAFAIEYQNYLALSSDDRLALQGRAWREHGAFINRELENHRALWILVVGGEVVDSGSTLENYPTDARLAELGNANDLVPWVFTRPS
jgi:phosphoribosylformylglycinamidine synthase